MIIIGVESEKHKPIVLDMLKKIISRTNKKFSIIKNYNLNPSTSMNKTILQNYLNELEKNRVEIVVIKLPSENIAQGMYQDIAFDILIYNSSCEKYHYNEELRKNHFEYQKKLFQSMNTHQIAVINSDDHSILTLVRGSKMYAVTYGFNSKVTVTASSIEENHDISTLICCIQRNIISIGKRNIEPQEFPVRISNAYDEYIYAALAAVTAALICDIQVQNIEKLVL